MKRFKLIILSLATFGWVAFVGCGPMKDMETMKQTTEKMAATTEEMRKSTATTQAEVEYSMLLGRAGGNANIRHLAWKDLMNEENGFTDKIVAGSEYLESFDFQQSSGIGADNSALREKLYAPAINEFYRKVNIPAEQLDIRNNQLSVSALGVALHMPFYLQEKLPIPFYQLIKGAVEKWVGWKAKKISKSEFKEYENTITRLMPVTHRLLQQRIEGLILVVFGGFADLTQYADPSFKVFKLGSKWNPANWGGAAWTPVIDNYQNNSFQIDFYSAALDYANQTIDLLDSAQLGHKIDSYIWQAASAMKLDKSRSFISDEDSRQLDDVKRRLDLTLSRLNPDSVIPSDSKPESPAPPKSPARDPSSQTGNLRGSRLNPRR